MTHVEQLKHFIEKDSALLDTIKAVMRDSERNARGPMQLIYEYQKEIEILTEQGKKDLDYWQEQVEEQELIIADLKMVISTVIKEKLEYKEKLLACKYTACDSIDNNNNNDNTTDTIHILHRKIVELQQCIEINNKKYKSEIDKLHKDMQKSQVSQCIDDGIGNKNEFVQSQSFEQSLKQQKPSFNDKLRHGYNSLFHQLTKMEDKDITLC